MKDPFVAGYHPSELKIAAEFLTTWFPYLTQDLCHTCTQSISNRIFSLDPELERIQLKEKEKEKEDSCDCDYDSDSNSLGSWKDSGNNGGGGGGGWSEHTSEVSTSYGQVSTPSSVRVSWADMAQQEEEDELEEEEEEEEEEERGSRRHSGLVEEEERGRIVVKKNSTTTLSREQREYLRFKNVERKKDFICLERFKGKHVNILEGLELHTGVFSAAEQTRIVDYIYQLQEKGRRGELKERTFSAPQKWMRGKGRETIQFGCCYNYAVLKDGNPPGILRNELVDPIPPLLKVIIRRLVGWHVLPPTCVPDSCIINIYEEGDCIPPHIDHHDFVRPFCTVSFLSECHILFGTNLKILGPGDFSGTVAIPLPVGSVLVLNGNGADVAKHCVPAVPTKRISITFRKMDETKRPLGFVPEPDLQGLQPLPYDIDDSNSTTPPKSQFQGSRSREFDSGRGRGFSGRANRSEPRYSGRPRSQSGTRRTVRMSLGT